MSSSFETRLRQAEQQAAADSFCPACMTTRFRNADEPPRPSTCPQCMRTADDYLPGQVREFVVCPPAPSAAGEPLDVLAEDAAVHAVDLPARADD